VSECGVQARVLLLNFTQSSFILAQVNSAVSSMCKEHMMNVLLLCTRLRILPASFQCPHSSFLCLCTVAVLGKIFGGLALIIWEATMAKRNLL